MEGFDSKSLQQFLHLMAKCIDRYQELGQRYKKRLQSMIIKGKNQTFYKWKQSWGETTIVMIKQISSLKKFYEKKKFFFLSQCLTKDDEQQRNDFLAKMNSQVVEASIQNSFEQMLKKMKSKQFSEYQELIVVSEKMYQQVLKNIEKLQSLNKIYFLRCFNLPQKEKNVNNSEMYQKSEELEPKITKITHDKIIEIFSFEALSQAISEPLHSFIGPNENQQYKKLKLRDIHSTFSFYEKLYFSQMMQLIKKYSKKQFTQVEYEKQRQFLVPLMNPFNIPQIQVDISQMNIIWNYSSLKWVYQFLNNGLRFFNNPFEIGYFSILFGKLSLEIQNSSILKSQSNKKIKTCYRGATFSAKQINYFKNNIGNIVQNVIFLSTSTSIEVAEKFQENVIIKIQILQDKLESTMRNNFIYMGNPNDNLSQYPSEQEVLFDVGSNFLVKQVKMRQDGIIEINLVFGMAARMYYQCKHQNKDYDNEKEIQTINGIIIDYNLRLAATHLLQLPDIHHYYLEDYITALQMYVKLNTESSIIEDTGYDYRGSVSKLKLFLRLLEIYEQKNQLQKAQQLMGNYQTLLKASILLIVSTPTVKGFDPGNYYKFGNQYLVIEHEIRKNTLKSNKKTIEDKIQCVKSANILIQTFQKAVIDKIIFQDHQPHQFLKIRVYAFYFSVLCDLQLQRNNFQEAQKMYECLNSLFCLFKRFEVLHILKALETIKKELSSKSQQSCLKSIKDLYACIEKEMTFNNKYLLEGYLARPKVWDWIQIQLVFISLRSEWQEKYQKEKEKYKQKEKEKQNDQQMKEILKLIEVMELSQKEY